jgi:hypothetical protein
MNNSLPIFDDDGISEDGSINMDMVVANFLSISDRLLALLPTLLEPKNSPIFEELDQEASRVYKGLLNVYLERGVQ